MKFRNGYWLYKEGYACFSPRQVYEISREDGMLELCAPTSLITGRGDTLKGVNLTIRITAPMPDVIRIQTCHHLGAVRKGPEFVLGKSLKNMTSEGKFTPEVEEASEREIIVRSGQLRLVIDKENWGMKYYRDDKYLTGSTITLTTAGLRIPPICGSSWGSLWTSRSTGLASASDLL